MSLGWTVAIAILAFNFGWICCKTAAKMNKETEEKKTNEFRVSEWTTKPETTTLG